ncbi:MAG: hypothetical protein H6722_12415 [Sandaracinus sp.]|nr:hypothetical protein [Sandaracinus sp.]MCB9613249.1 hypothetical protein [Sandaracinus sp.]
MTTTSLQPSFAPRLVFALFAWVALATVAAASGLISFERPWFVPLTLLGTTTALVAAYTRSEPFRALLDRVDLRLLVGWHVVRAPIGASFLVLASRGELPELFASRAGWGDLAAGLGALLVLPMLTRVHERTPRRLALLWNLFALADILLVVATAQYLFLIVHDPLMARLGSLPFGLLPTFVVPLVITTHLLVFRRLRAA